MIKLKLLKFELKRIWILIVVLMVMIFGIFCVNFTQQRMSTYSIRQGDGYSYFLGTGFMMNILYFKTLGMIFFGFYGIISAYLSITQEIDKGYIGSWLTLPISRTKILNTKLLASSIGFISLWVWSLIVQVITLSISTTDFKEYVVPWLLTNISFFGVIFVFFALSWLIAILVKSNLMLVILIILLMVFVGLSLFSIGDQQNKIFKYLTINSLFSNGLEFNKIDGSCEKIGADICVGTLKNNNINFAWKIPTTIIISSTMIVGTSFIFKNKNFSI